VVSRKLAALSGQPTLRMKDSQPLVTDNGCYILDVADLQIANPAQFEATVNNIVGVVTVGLFAQRCADVALLGTSDGVKKLTF
jgi:ribose 5-phosphate isomerase A